MAKVKGIRSKVKAESPVKQTRERSHVEWTYLGGGSTVSEVAGALLSAEQTKGGLFQVVMKAATSDPNKQTNIILSRSGRLGKLTEADLSVIVKAFDQGVF